MPQPGGLAMSAYGKSASAVRLGRRAGPRVRHPRRISRGACHRAVPECRSGASVAPIFLFPVTSDTERAINLQGNPTKPGAPNQGGGRQPKPEARNHESRSATSEGTTLSVQRTAVQSSGGKRQDATGRGTSPGRVASCVRWPVGKAESFAAGASCRARGASGG